MKMGRFCFVLLAAIAMILGARGHASAQVPPSLPYSGQYHRGLDVVPVYEGWKPNPDGSFALYFGYFNRNFDEELDIPIGPDNNIEPGMDRGQPTHFYPRRQMFVFKIDVPKDFGLERRIVWTLNIRGKSSTAKGWLKPEWEINDEVMMENAGAGNDTENEPPVITGSGPQSTVVSSGVTLAATAQDDGRPKPKRQRNTNEGGNASQGLSIRWILYRGPGPVTFTPSAPATGYGKPVESKTQASFKVPGVYVLRAVASDGALETFHDVTVTVK